MNDDKRLIEDYLPIEKISAEASREKSIRKGHISTLHLWWARRPLVACRAAVYGALVPSSRFVPNGASDEKKKSLGRANAAKFVERLCQYPGNPSVIAEAQRHILEAHAERLTQETGKNVTVEDIVEGRAPKPKVLDMFAGGGAIPLEALRLGCETYALDLNPVAHIIELCTLVYPQEYGKPDSKARGMAGTKNAKGETTWGGLAEEVRYWGHWVHEKVKAEIGDLYPLIPDPEYKGKKAAAQRDLLKKATADEMPPGFLIPITYLWTRTVTCKNPHCRATIPLVKQTWLSKKPGQCVALKVIAPKGQKEVRFQVVEARTKQLLGLDPEGRSRGAGVTCPFCASVADSEYVHGEGRAHRIGIQLMAVAVANSSRKGRSYLSSDVMSPPSADRINSLIRELAKDGYSPPNETIPPTGNAGAATGISFLYGMETFGEIFLPRQLATLLSCVRAVRKANEEMSSFHVAEAQIKSLTSYLALAVSRLTNQNNTLCVYHSGRETVEGCLGRKRLIYSWDFPETNPLAKTSGGFDNALDWITSVLEALTGTEVPADVRRGSASRLPFEDSIFDAVITDPPYYDNIGYSELSDFFYVWLKKMIGNLFPEHFSAPLTPKKEEAVAAAYRQGGSQELAKAAYHRMMLQSFKEASRVLKPRSSMVTIYAHKTTSGWSTLVDALRQADFEVVEAWPLDTELQTGVTKQDMAMLASSISIVARKRQGKSIGNFDQDVRPELERIVRERVGTLWEMGISGADLVVASVGAGLRAFTRFAKVEYANGEEVPAERFLTEVETVVLETILARLSKEVGGDGDRYSLAGLDTATRFYVLWRFTYKAIDLDAGEAIIFANGTHIELEGAHGLSDGSRPLLVKNKSRYHLFDYAERGDDAALGIPSDDGQPSSLIDVLHRLLWLMERHPSNVGEFLRDARPNTEQMRLVAQALAGPALKGGELGEVASGSELAALTKLTANWRSVVEDVDLTHIELEGRRTGQGRIQFDKGGRR